MVIQCIANLIMLGKCLNNNDDKDDNNAYNLTQLISKRKYSYWKWKYNVTIVFLFI